MQHFLQNLLTLDLCTLRNVINLMHLLHFMKLKKEVKSSDKFLIFSYSFISQTEYKLLS